MNLPPVGLSSFLSRFYFNNSCVAAPLGPKLSKNPFFGSRIRNAVPKKNYRPSLKPKVA